MKKIFSILFIAFISCTNAQFQDDFTDSDFSNNPTWLGEMANFEINASNQLHLNAPAVNDESYLVTASNAAVDGYWEFYVDLQFNPSSSNKAYVYLISDQQDLKGSLNGYYVLIGNTTDEISLYKQSGNSSTKIIDGIDGSVATSPKVKIKVTRDLLGNFELFSDTSTSFNNYISEGIVFDNDFIESNYFGVLCEYTSTRSDKFIFDNFDVTAQEYIDIFPPTITNFEVLSLNSLKLTFSESLNVSTVENINNFIVDNGISLPTSIIYNNTDKTALLNFSLPFQSNINYNLTISNIEDLNSNALNTVLPFEIENAYSFETIIFNEILADETPSFGLPTYEFIELKNLQNDTLFTEGWFISDLTDTSYFNVDTILPNEFVIVGKTTAETYYEGFGKTFGLTSFISLNKDEDKLTLYNKYGAVIDSLHYFDDWFKEEQAPNDAPKVDGGWSLERIFDDFSCSASYNWFPSIDNLGGTPGEENSIYNTVVDTISIPEILSAVIVNDTLIKIVFSDNVGNAFDISIYEINSTKDFYVTNYSINNIVYENGSYFLILDDAIDLNSVSLILSGLEDCYGSVVDLRLPLFRLKHIIHDDLIINEILFNPFTGAEDYLELHNTTNFTLNLKGLQIVEYDIFEEDSITDYSAKFEEDFWIKPNSYIVFSEDTIGVLKNYIVYRQDHLFQINLPNFSDKESIVALVFNDSIVLDRLHYFSRWSFELLDSEDGVSLERISSNNATQDNDNWASAAKSFGYGTPTAKNSQSFERINQDDLISIEPEVFTPNQDGDKDFAIISYKIDNAGFVANVSVFDLVGRKIKDIAYSETISTEGFWKWDGTNYNNEKAKVGIYIVLIELFDLEGNKKIFKEKVVLGSQL